MTQNTEKLIQIGGLLGIIVLAFVLNAIVSLIWGAILHVAGCSDLVAVGSSIIVSAGLWNIQFKSLRELIGE